MFKTAENTNSPSWEPLLKDILRKVDSLRDRPRDGDQILCMFYAKPITQQRYVHTGANPR